MKKDLDRFLEKNYPVLFIGILISGILLRIIGLGTDPLSEKEAKLALMALRLFSGNVSQTGPILYTLPTAIFFHFFGDSAFTARLFPAICGILSIILPFRMRKSLGTWKSLFFSLIFAVEPALLFWSKKAEVLLPLIILLTASLSAFYSGKTRWGICLLCFSVLGGARFWPIFIAALISFGFLWLLNKAYPSHFSFHFPEQLRKITKTDILWGIGTMVLASSAFFTFPRGIGSLGNGVLLSFKEDFSRQNPGVIPFIIGLFIYCGCPFLILCCCPKQSSKTTLIIGLLIWQVILLLFGEGVFIYPMLAMILWFFAAGPLQSFLNGICGMKARSWGMSCLIFCFFSMFLYLRLSEFALLNDIYQPMVISWKGTQHILPFSQLVCYLLILIIVFLILFLVFQILSAYIDSQRLLFGMKVGCVILAGLVMVSNIWNAGGFRRENDSPIGDFSVSAPELMDGVQKTTASFDLFERIRETSLRTDGTETGANGAYLIKNDVLLQWQLRKFSLTGEITDDTKFIIDQENASYNEKGFVGTKTYPEQMVLWDQFTLQEWLRWMIYREAPFTTIPVSFWMPFQLLSED